MGTLAEHFVVEELEVEGKSAGLTIH